MGIFGRLLKYFSPRTLGNTFFGHIPDKRQRRYGYALRCYRLERKRQRQARKIMFARLRTA